MTSVAEDRLRPFLTPDVTGATAEGYADLQFAILSGRDADAQALGVHQVSGPDVTLVVTDPHRPVGDVRIQAGGHGTFVFIDNRTWTGNLLANVRLLGDECALVFNDIGDGFARLSELFLRSHRQFVFWGRGSTAVDCSIELEGEGQGIIVGDDALISNGVWLRNHDMHALHDLRTGARIGRSPVTMVVERHVWLGQDVLVLGCERIGMGSVIGARSLVKQPIPRRVAAAGTPARVLRQDVSWGRDLGGMTEAERAAVGLASVEAQHAR